MTISDGKKRVMVALDVDLLEQFDALCRERGQYRAHVIEAMMRRSLVRQGRPPPSPRPDPRQFDIEEHTAPPSPSFPADESTTRAGSATAREGSRTVPQAQTFERD